MYKPNKKKLRAMAEEINNKVYNSELDITNLKFKIKKSHETAMAFYEYPGIITVYKSHHKNKFDYFTTIAHELIHYLQCANDIPTNHNGAAFRYYRKKTARIYKLKTIQI